MWILFHNTRMAKEPDKDNNAENLREEFALKKIVPTFVPPLAAKSFGFGKKDVREVFDALSRRMILTSMIASVLTVVMGIIFTVFVLAPVWAAEKINVWNIAAPLILLGGGALSYTLLLFAVMSKRRVIALEIVGDIVFRTSLALALCFFFVADIINGDLSQGDSITAAMGLLFILVICQPGYLWEVLAGNLAVFLMVLSVAIYGVVVHNMYAFDQYILFLLGFLIAGYFVYSSYWYAEAQRHYISSRNADLLVRSTHDALTSARNRQGLRFYLDERLPGWKAKGESLLVVMFDIDDFKLYNDTFGHLEGDQVLIDIVKAIEHSPDIDHIRTFRYGGEEFLLLRSKVTKQEAENLLEAVRSTIEKLHFPAPLESKDPYLTISLGGSLWTITEDYRFHDQLDEADKALYEAKRSGKNRFVLKTRIIEPPVVEEETPTLLEAEKPAEEEMPKKKNPKTKKASK